MQPFENKALPFYIAAVICFASTAAFILLLGDADKQTNAFQSPPESEIYLERFYWCCVVVLGLLSQGLMLGLVYRLGTYLQSNGRAQMRSAAVALFLGVLTAVMLCAAGNAGAFKPTSDEQMPTRFGLFFE